MLSKKEILHQGREIKLYEKQEERGNMETSPQRLIPPARKSRTKPTSPNSPAPPLHDFDSAVFPTSRCFPTLPPPPLSSGLRTQMWTQMSKLQLRWWRWWECLAIFLLQGRSARKTKKKRAVEHARVGLGFG